MYKNQLQELAQRSCFNLPSYSCIREGPDHAPRFKATVNFNGETFESPTFCSTLRQAEHAAAEVALNTIASRGPSRTLAARVLDETGVYKNLLQETAHRAGLKLPVYTTVRTGPGHIPSFLCTIELAGMSFTGEPARTKKQAQKNAATAAWSALKKLIQRPSSSSSSSSSSSQETKKGSEEQEQVIIARILSSLQASELKSSKISDCKSQQQRFIPACKDLTPPRPNLCPMQCQSWAYPTFYPEMALYQMWQQEQLLQLQNHLLAHQARPSPPPGPQILPYMHSILPQGSSFFVPLKEQEPMPVPVRPRIAIAASGPSIYLDPVVADQSRGKSTVKIQEIPEERKEESSECSSTMTQDSHILGNLSAESRLKEPVHDDNKLNSSELEKKLEQLKLEELQNGKFNWASRGSTDTGCIPVDFPAQNSHGFQSSQFNVQFPSRPSLPGSFRSSPPVASPVMIRHIGPIPSTATAPVVIQNMRHAPSAHRPQDLPAQIHVPPRMRTGIHSHSTRPQPQRMDIGGIRPRCMAPAVRIRSVIPVYSAPPARTMPASNQEGVLLDREKMDTISEQALPSGSELNKH